MKRISCFVRDEDKTFAYLHKGEEFAKTESFKLHSHDEYEILIILSGSADFLVEGNIYHLVPPDIVLVRYDEMHQITNISDKNYERIIINLKDSFFKSNGLERYSGIFFDEGNLIEGNSVKKSDLLSTLARFEKYAGENRKGNRIVAKCVLIEFLHQLCELKKASPTAHDSLVKSAIDYINDHLSESLSLDTLSEKLYVSKYHLCRRFRECTGITVNQYITDKRIMLAKNLCKDGKSIGYACSEAGFSTYSAFYKAYIKRMGFSPRKGFISEGSRS